MAKTKSVSAGQVEKIIKMFKTTESEIAYGDGEDAIVIKVNPKITLSDKYLAVHEIAGYVISEDLNIDSDFAIYEPSYFNIAFGWVILHRFTNVKVENTAKCFDLITYTPIIRDVCNILGDIADDIHKEALELIEFKKNKLLKSTKAEDLFEALKVLIDSISDMTPKDGVAMESIMDMLNKFTGNQSGVTTRATGLNPDTIVDMAESLKTDK